MTKRIAKSIMIFATLLLVVSGFLAASPAAIAAGSACKVTYTLANQWPGGFQANLTIANTGTTAINGWVLGFGFPGDQKVGQGWDATWTQTGANVSAASYSWDATIAPGATLSGLGFTGTFASNNTAPTTFSINGSVCGGAVASPPTVALISPAAGATYQAPANIPLTATASAASGATITRVEFYNGTALLGTTTAAPYTFSFNNVAAGSYSLTAKAYDSNGASSTSAPVAVTVTTPTTPAVLTSTSALNVNVGGTGTVGVDLSAQPTGNVTVSVAKTGSANISVTAGAALTFTPANWNQLQNVTVAVAAGATVGDTATLTAAATGYTSAAVTVTAQSNALPTLTQRFLNMYNDLKNPANGYFSAQGIPYHTPETLIVEAPDYGHETTSEAFSYWIWLEATYGQNTGNWQPFNNAWTTMETYMIPSQADQPTNAAYNPNSPAQYAPESVKVSDYPTMLSTTVSVGQDPLANELKQTYGNPNIYGMHWLLDVDNWYGYGHCGDGTTKPSFINSYQRGATESVWKTVVQPSCETFAFGGPVGFLDLFNKPAAGGSYSKQWRFTDAPDADARTVQAAYWAYTWATAQGKFSSIASTVAKAAKMGDYLRYSFYDKYFKNPGCTSESCAAGTGKSSSNYLLSWYYAWGGSVDTSSPWAWRIGSSASHQGYQNPLAAYALSTISALKPLSPTAAADWSTSLSRQLQFYQWLQSSEGAIAGGATNSWEGHYGTPPAGDATFYGLAYDPQPEYHDPPSNQWFGFQAWSMERVAEYYHETGDASAKKVLDKWVAWASAHTTLNADGTYSIPSTLSWSGQPDTWNAASPGSNAGLHVTVVDTTVDVGVAAAFAKTLMYYAAKAGNAPAQTLAKALIDRMWTNYRDSKGVSNPEVRKDYSQFNDVIYFPAGWTGKNGQGATLNSSTTFLTERPKYLQDPAFSKVQAYLNGGPAPTFTYHRFWAQSDIAMANADYGILFP